MTTRDETNLGELIAQQLRLNRLSYSQIVARAKERGERLGKSNLGRVRVGDNPSISRATIFGLAAGLGIAPSTVARAALADMGITLAERDADTETAIRTDPTLPEQGRRLLLAMLGEIKSQGEVGVRGADQAADQDDWELDTPSDEDMEIADRAATKT